MRTVSNHLLSIAEQWHGKEYAGLNLQENTCVGVSRKLQTVETGRVALKEAAINIGSPSKMVSSYEWSEKKSGWKYWILFIFHLTW